MATGEQDLDVRITMLEEAVAALHRQNEALREELRALAHVVGRGEAVPAAPR